MVGCLFFNCRVSHCSTGWPGTYYTAQVSLELTAVLLHQSPKCWDFESLYFSKTFLNSNFWVTIFRGCLVLGIVPRVLHMLGKILSIIPSLQLPGFFFFYKILFAVIFMYVSVLVYARTCICVGIHSCVHLQRAEKGSRHPPLLPSNYSFEAGSLPERKVCVYFIVLLCFAVCLGLKASKPHLSSCLCPLQSWGCRCVWHGWWFLSWVQGFRLQSSRWCHKSF